MSEEMIEKVAIAIRDVTQGEGFDYMDFCRDAARAAVAAYNPNERLREALPDDECAICGKKRNQHNMGSGYAMCQIYPLFESKRAMFDRLSALSPLPQGEDT